MENIIRIETEDIEYFIGAMMEQKDDPRARLLFHEEKTSVFALKTSDIQQVFEIGAEFGKQKVCAKTSEKGSPGTPSA